MWYTYAYIRDVVKQLTGANLEMRNEYEALPCKAW